MSSIGQIVQNQKNYFSTGKTKSVAGRIHNLKKLKKLLIDNENKLVAALKKDLGKSHYECLITELVPTFEEIDLFCKNIKSWSRPTSVSTPIHVQPARSKILKEAYGVVAVFAPWNYPLALVLSPAIGAIAAGNCAILKPADLSSHTQGALIEIINENFDPGILHVIGGGIPECNELLEQKLDFIFFTGSPRVGKIIMSAAAKNLTPVCLELGGKSPCIVDKTANIKMSAKRIVWAKLLNTGQTCVAPDYFYVHEEVKDQLVEAFKNEIVQSYGDEPLNSDLLGHIISQDHFNRITGYLESAKIIFGGKSDSSRKKIEPTILTDVTWDSPVMEEEIFGPLFPILSFKDLDKIISEINDRPKPLALYLFSEDNGNKKKVLANTSSGGACINDCIVHLGNPNLPFGGVGNSGMGAYHGKQSFDLLSHSKSVLESSTALDSPMRYPKSVEKKMKLVKWWFS